MKKILTAILCGLLFIALSTSAATKQPPQTPDNSPVIPEFSTDLKLQQQKLEFFKDRLDSQDKRIGDLTFYLSLSLACFGVLMTVIVVFFSLRSTKEAVLSAKDEARKEVEAQAKIMIEVWLGKEGQSLLEKEVEDTLRPVLDEALADIHSAADGVLTGLEKEQRKAHDHNSKQEQLNAQHEKTISELMAIAIDKAKPLSEEQRKAVNKAAKELDAKPPKEYSFEDWFMLGAQAFESGKYETAEDHLSRAVENATDPVNRAAALVSKGITLSKMQRYEEAIANFDEVVRRFGEATATTFSLLVAIALSNKGFTLNHMQRSEEAIIVFDEVVRRFGEATEVKLREQVATAYNSIGFNLLCNAKKVWQGGDNTEAVELLTEALSKIETALKERSDEWIFLGNQGYILFLLGRREEAQPILVRAFSLGGEELRQAELKDADIHTLPQDEAFRELILGL